MIKHLKAFFTRQEMLDDWNKSCGAADECHFNQMTMTKDGETTLYVYYSHLDEGKRLMQSIMGLEISSIQSDIRIPQETQWYMFSRIRSGDQHAKLTMEMFCKEIR